MSLSKDKKRCGLLQTLQSVLLCTVGWVHGTRGGQPADSLNCDLHHWPFLCPGGRSPVLGPEGRWHMSGTHSRQPLVLPLCLVRCSQQYRRSAGEFVAVGEFFFLHLRWHTSEPQEGAEKHAQVTQLTLQDAAQTSQLYRKTGHQPAFPQLPSLLCTATWDPWGLTGGSPPSSLPGMHLGVLIKGPSW